MQVKEVSIEANTNNDIAKGMVSHASKTDLSGMSNAYIVVDDSKLNPNENGRTQGDNLDYIQVKESSKDAKTGAHEVGHTLGPDHFSEGIMTSNAADPKRNNNIPEKNIKKIIENNKDKIQEE